jgi:threonine/homoserine/homoserine lactone efflux protein
MAYFHGVGIGLLFVFTFGPTFFAILQSSIARGFKAGALTALGISLCDIVYSTIATQGLKGVEISENIKWWLAIVGGIALLILGLLSFFTKPKITPVDPQLRLDSPMYRYFVKGLIINGLNPFVIFFWMGMAGSASVNWGYSDFQTQIFVIGMLSSILTTDLLKSFLANRIRRWVTPARIAILNKVIGIALILFSLQLFYEVLK